MVTYRLQLPDGTSLQATKKGDVFLQIRDVLYEPQDVIPRGCAPNPAVAKQDARSYVVTCCIYEYGPNHSRWPALARAFVDENGHFEPGPEKTLNRPYVAAEANEAQAVDEAQAGADAE